MLWGVTHFHDGAPHLWRLVSSKCGGAWQSWRLPACMALAEDPWFDPMTPLFFGCAFLCIRSIAENCWRRAAVNVLPFVVVLVGILETVAQLHPPFTCCQDRLDDVNVYVDIRTVCDDVTSSCPPLSFAWSSSVSFMKRKDVLEYAERSLEVMMCRLHDSGQIICCRSSWRECSNPWLWHLRRVTDSWGYSVEDGTELL